MVRIPAVIGIPKDRADGADQGASDEHAEDHEEPREVGDPPDDRRLRDEVGEFQPHWPM
jgi:hypothetical protein